MAGTALDILASRGIESEELNHYGIKGMKWGKRRSAKQIAAARQKEDLSKMSDDDLKKKIARIKLEQEYSKLTTTPKGKSAIKSGGKAVAKLLLQVGEQEAKAYLKDQGKDALIKAIKSQRAKKAAVSGLAALATGK